MTISRLIVPSALLCLLCATLTGCSAVSKSTETTFDPGTMQAIARNEAYSPHLYSLPAPTQAISAEPPQTSDKENAIIRTYFATNRQFTGKSLPYEAFGAEDSKVTYGVADVSIPRDHRLGEFEGPWLGIRMLESKKKHIMLMGVETLDQQALFELITQKVAETKGKSALVFVHGYTVSFEDAARRTAQLSYDLGFEGAPIFYSWPSNESVPKYGDDEHVIERSTPMFKAFLEDVFKRTGAENVYLVAHSMGNRAMASAMAALIDDAQVHAKVRRLIFTAPDVDAAEFEGKLAPPLVAAGVPVTVYASSKDVALLASKQVHHRKRRLGDTRGDISIVKGIETIDASAVKTDFLGHSYFAENGSVVSDIFYLFRTDLRPGERFNMKGLEVAKGRYWAFQPGLCKP
ncbi:MAG: alpha/beta hydrolase [Pseudomonas sp.]|uniref:alpha/beta hydrolase n=1 Tax=Pseudomonas sp. TaxID=306 RepID=UPI0030EFB6A8